MKRYFESSNTPPTPAAASQILHVCPWTAVSQIVSQILHVCPMISLYHLADFLVFPVSVSHGSDNDGNDDDDNDDDDNGGEWPNF